MQADLETAAGDLQTLADGPAREAADSIEQAFERAGQSIERSLAAAARSGELDFSRMTQSILADLARLAVDRWIVAPAMEALPSSPASWNGARAEGGPLAPGQAYLVGERGPEVITSSGAARVDPLAGAVTVNLTLPGTPDAADISTTRLARQLARAVQKGRRFT